MQDPTPMTDLELALFLRLLFAGPGYVLGTPILQ